MSLTAIRSAVAHALSQGKVRNYVTGDEMKEILKKADTVGFGWFKGMAGADKKELLSLHESARMTFRDDAFEPAQALDKPTLSYSASLQLWNALKFEVKEGQLRNRPTIDGKL